MASNPHGQFPWFGCLITLGIVIGVLVLSFLAFLMLWPFAE